MPVNWPSAWPASRTTAPCRSLTIRPLGIVRDRAGLQPLDIHVGQHHPMRRQSLRDRPRPKPRQRSRRRHRAGRRRKTAAQQIRRARRLDRGVRLSLRLPPSFESLARLTALCGGERHRYFIEGPRDVQAIELEGLVDLAVKRRPHQLLVLGHIVAQRCVRHDRKRNIAFGLFEKRDTDR